MPTVASLCLAAILSVALLFSGRIRRLCNSLCDDRRQTHSSSGRGKPAASPAGASKPRFHLTMGLRGFGQEGWLTIDDNYVREHEVKLRLLATRGNSVFGCLPAAEPACGEVLEMVVECLTGQYPQLFRLSAEGEYIEAVRTNETYGLGRSSRRMHPLEIAARLAMEDLNVLAKGKNDQHEL
jgi:hypothetical protein